MLLVLTSLDDAPALAFVAASRAGGVPVTVVTTEALSFARHTSHRLCDDGVGSRLELADGTVVSGDQVTGVLNRTVAAPDLAWRHAAAAERTYAAAELFALTLAWVDSLPCPVRNRPSPTCLAGPAPHPLAAAAAALGSGLTAPAVRMGAESGPDPATAVYRAAASAAGGGARLRQVVCLDGAVVGGDVPAGVRDGIARLTVSLGMTQALVGVDFLVAGGAWWFAGTTPLPELRLGGAELVSRLVDLLHPEPAGVRS